MKPPFISATLFISEDYQVSAIQDRIDSGNPFTLVPMTDPSKVIPNGIALINLQNRFNNQFTSYLCTLKKQGRVATATVRLKGTNMLQLPEIVPDEIFTKLPKKFQKLATETFYTPYFRLSPKFGENYYKIIRYMFPKQSREIDRLYQKTQNVPLRAQGSRIEDAAIERDALGLSLDIFGVDRTKILRQWEANGTTIGDSFLTGLEEYNVYEDDIISNDLHNIPGYQLIKEDITGTVEFEDSYGDKLLVINANRKPLERATGVDLVYFHRKYEAFTMVQYKMMDNVDSKSNQYYNPKQKSHDDELERMCQLQSLLNKESKGSCLNEYRFSDCPIFFKLCKKLQLKGDDGGIAPGAYITLDQWKLLLEDESTKGKNGGTQIGYHTLNRRYMRRQSFIELIQSGLIGTQASGSEKLGLFIQAAVENGHSVMYAIDNSNKNPEKNPEKNRLEHDISLNEDF